MIFFFLIKKKAFLEAIIKSFCVRDFHSFCVRDFYSFCVLDFYSFCVLYYSYTFCTGLETGCEPVF